ncbi:hypothetical protein F4810DRAFT_689415 [Camillea tinctor]|nr:hypothetical protein F4810DRAFT_689415 [Camillea tinctor]
MIMWVACAKRDLLLGELDLVLKLRDLKQDGIVRLDDELKTRFGSFFDVVYPAHDTDEDEDDISVLSNNNRGQPDAEIQEGIDTDSDQWTDCEEEEEEEEEEEDDEATPDMYFKATVKFEHASVDRHFRTAPIHEGIGVDCNMARTHMATTCLLFVNGNIPSGLVTKGSKGYMVRTGDEQLVSADDWLDTIRQDWLGT